MIALFILVLLSCFTVLFAIRNELIFKFRSMASTKIYNFCDSHITDYLFHSEHINSAYRILDNPSYSKMVLLMLNKWTYNSFFGSLENRLQEIFSNSPSTLNEETTMTNTNSTAVTNTEDTLDFDHSIVEYIRGERNHPKGMMMAVIDRKDNTIHVGWSLTRSGSKDKFIKDRAYDIAMGRVVLADVHKVTIPFELVDSICGELPLLEQFVLRSKKYFRSDKVTVFGRVRKEVPNSSQLVYEEFQHS